MKFLALFSAGLVSMALAACGQSSSGQPTTSATRSSQGKERLAMTKAEIAKLPQFTIRALHRPPPSRLVIRDLRKGFGAKLERGDTMLVEFAGAKWGYTVKTTPATRNAPEKYAFDEIVPGWKEATPGMRVGGRREFIVPRQLSTVGDAVTYVVDLLAIER
jgi:FKBP-type peptidyl-prolyl cis-trans isomerase